MKNLLLSIPLIILFSSCGNSSTNQGVDYFFELEFGGETHEVRGNTADDEVLTLTNCSYASLAGLQTGITFKISDKSGDNYKSGENLCVILSVDNLSIGTNTGSLYFDSSNGSWLGDYLETIGVEYPYYFSETQGVYSSSSINTISGISITDLGTSTTYYQNGCNSPNLICYGETLKGSYQSTLYFVDRSVYPYTYSIAVPIKIEFNAVRSY